eukprot:373277-Heterocapsa_arctica.AAC.1
MPPVSPGLARAIYKNPLSRRRNLQVPEKGKENLALCPAGNLKVRGSIPHLKYLPASSLKQFTS